MKEVVIGVEGHRLAGSTYARGWDQCGVIGYYSLPPWRTAYGKRIPPCEEFPMTIQFSWRIFTRGLANIIYLWLYHLPCSYNSANSYSPE